MNMNDRDREKVKQLLTDAVTLLCKSSLRFEEEVTVEGLIGITLDKKDIILVSIRETLQQTFCRVSESRNHSIESQDNSLPSSPKRRKRHHSSGSSVSTPSVDDSENYNLLNENNCNTRTDMDNEKALNMVKKEMDDDQKKEEVTLVNSPAENASGKDSPVVDLIKKEITDDADCCVVGEESSPSPAFPVIDWPAAAAAVFDSAAETILPGTSYHSSIAYFLQSKVAGSLGSGGPVFPTLEINPTSQPQPQHSSPAASSVAEVEENRTAGPTPARKWYRCAFCGVGYNWKQSYQRHLLLKHLGQGYMCPLCSRRFARKDHLQRHYYNCKRRYGVSNAEDPVYVTAMVQAGMANNNNNSSSQGQAGDTIETFNSLPIHRGRGRPRGSRNKIFGLALNSEAHKVMPICNNNNSAEEESQSAETEGSRMVSNDQAVLLPIYRAAKISSQVANKDPESESESPEPSSN